MSALWVVDPDIVYIVLVLGLWIGVTAAYLPGTGIPEVLAIVLTVVSIITLTAMPTNWIAAAVLIIGVSAFVILPFAGERYSRYAELGLILQAAGGYLLFPQSPVSPVLIAISVLVAMLYHRLALIPFMRSQRKQTEFDATLEIIGVRGRVVSDLNPVGTVYVNKEMWRARSAEPLSRDAVVIVVAQDGLELIVEKAKHEDTTEIDHSAQHGVTASAHR